jgi:hypothetical protein
MLVYGDAERVVATHDALAALAGALDGVSRAALGIERHSALVTAFIQASELVQGIADAAFEARGFDERTPLQDAGMGLLLGLAAAVGRSWRSGFVDQGEVPTESLDALATGDLPDAIRTKQAEGYAFYTLYPEAFFEAASGLEGGRWRVIGIRSIGVGLAAMVAAALGDQAPITVRPVGHPFQRQLAVSVGLAAEIAGEREARFAIVDEGPGLSGSSFGAVIDWLEEQGIARDRIHAFPSHRGDLGPQASAAHRERWSGLPRHVTDFGDLVLRPAHAMQRLAAWFSDSLGPPLALLDDLSGGAWRHRVFEDEGTWPASNIQQERRKYLLRTEDGSWLLRFVGLGPDPARKLERAQTLHAAGFAPEVRAYRHGFLAECWIEDAQPLDRANVDRAVLLDTIGRYLAFRSRHFEARDRRGASLGELLAMARYNSEQRLGPKVASRFEAFVPHMAALEAKVRRVDTDNRMHRHEWLAAPDGRILKTDALDHSAAHDLVGCQDIAWDVVGASVELGLSEDETRRLAERIGREAGHPVHPELLAFYRPCYLAFHLGAATMAAQALAGCEGEAQRLNRAADRYADLLPASVPSTPSS